MNRIIIFFTVLLLIPFPLFAAGRISGGIYTGYQYDTGNLSEKNVVADLQQNVAVGALLKIDLGFLFFRTGADYSCPVEKGRFSGESAGDVLETEISFIEAPLYAGFNIPVRDYGQFYMGGGGSYIFGMGSIKTSSGRESINEQLFGYGFITGIESEISADISIFFEWEYMSAASSPVAATGTGTYDDYYIDYTGSRYRFGFLYHFNRY